MQSSKLKFLAGFTLAEILIVICIFGALAAISIPKYSFMLRRSYAISAADTLRQILSSQKRYKLYNNQWPPNEQFLDIKLGNLPGGWGPSGSRRAYFLWTMDNATTWDCTTRQQTFQIRSAIMNTQTGVQLYINDNGKIICLPCNDRECKAFGFDQGT